MSQASPSPIPSYSERYGLLRPQTAIRPVVGGSAGRLRELSIQHKRPTSASPVMPLKFVDVWEDEYDSCFVKGIRHTSDEYDTSRMLPGRAQSSELDIPFSWTNENVDQKIPLSKPSFHAAVREYEKNLASLRKERDAMLNTITPMRHQLEGAERKVKAMEAERQDLLAVRECSTSASAALNESIDKLSVANRRIRNLEKQLKDNENDWKQDRRRMMTQVEDAERRSAELAGGDLLPL